MGVYSKLGEFLRDLCSLEHRCGIIEKFFALRVPDTNPVFDMKEIFHGGNLRLNQPSVWSKALTIRPEPENPLGLPGDQGSACL